MPFFRVLLEKPRSFSWAYFTSPEGDFWAKSPGLLDNSVGVDLSPADVFASPSLSFTTWWPILWDHPLTWRGPQMQYQICASWHFPFFSLQAPVNVQCLCWKSQESDKKEHSFSLQEEMDPTLQKSQHHSLPSTGNPLLPSCPMSGLALPLLWLLGSPVLAVFTDLRRH